MASVADLDTVARSAVGVRLAWIAGGVTFAIMVAGAMYLWVVRGDLLFLDGALAAFCL
jgi:hypothetical protein